MAVGVTGLAFNTLCLAYVDAAFFQIARGMLLPLTAVVSSVVTRNPPSYSAILAILIVSIGYFVGITPSAYFTSSTTTDQTTPFVSIIYGTLSSLFLAVHAVLVKPAAQAVDGKVISLVYYGNVMSAFVLLPLMVLNGEVEPFLKLVTAGGEEARVFAYGSAVTGLFGFFIGLATIMSIKVTSPVSHMFSSVSLLLFSSMLSLSLMFCPGRPYGDSIRSVSLHFRRHHHHPAWFLYSRDSFRYAVLYVRPKPAESPNWGGKASIDVERDRCREGGELERGGAPEKGRSAFLLTV